MSQKTMTCCKCKKMSSFNTRYLNRAEPVEAGEGGKKIYIISCMHCGAENKVEVWS